MPCILICLHKFEFSFKIVYSVQNFKAFENLLNIPGFFVQYVGLTWEVIVMLI